MYRKVFRKEFLTPMLAFGALNYVAFWLVGRFWLDSFNWSGDWYLQIQTVAALGAIIWVLIATIWSDSRLMLVPVGFLIYAAAMPFFGYYSGWGNAVWSGVSAWLLLVVLSALVNAVVSFVLHGAGELLFKDENALYSGELEVNFFDDEDHDG